RFSLNWAWARRAYLLVTETALTCGDWRIPYEEIEATSLVIVPFGFEKFRVLMVRWQGRTNQFRIPSESIWRIVNHPFWDSPLPFPVKRKEGAIERPPLWLILSNFAIDALASLS